MVRVIFVLIGVLSMKANAQQEIYIRPGLLATSMTISPSLMLNQNEKNIYLTGFIEGFLDKRVSFRGEGNLVIGGVDKTPFYEKGFRTTAGILFHANKNNLDAHVGLMPGVYIASLSNNLSAEGESQLSVAPVISLNAGGTFYMWKYAHVFMNVTYTSTSFRKVYRNINGRADELMFSVGLGFNFNALKN